MHDPLTEQVIAALAKVKPGSTNGISPDDTLESLKLDSLDRITLLFELEDRLEVSIPDDDVRGLETVGDVIECIRRLQDSALAG